MEIYGSANNWNLYKSGLSSISTIERLLDVTTKRQNAVKTSQNRLPALNDRGQPVDNFEHVMRMRQAIEAIRPMIRESEIEVSNSTSATSASNLGLTTTDTPTTVQSTEEVNTTPTSFSTHAPEYTVSSTAQATISGEYDGSNGTGTLTVRVDMGGTHGVDKMKLTVLDSNNNAIGVININKKDALDNQYSLSNGLVLTLGEGELVNNDTFTLNVDGSAPPSYSPSEPDWAGSTASATVAGVYDGSNGSDTLTFTVTAGGAHGQDVLQITVFDSSNNQIDQININSIDSIDQQYTLSNGLTLTLGEGDLLVDSSFTLDVSDGVGTAVNPDNAFNGSGSDDPNLEEGLSITDGSFEINGTTIDVNAGESINTVLDRITQSDANVTATFDAATETVSLTQKTTGEGQEIVLENDTSGFLAAMKLDGAAAVPGTASETEKSLAEVESFSSVQSGSISVNGESINIDINTDSLTDVLDRITASGADVTASFDSSSQRVSLNSDNPDNQLILDSNSTDFFSAVGISDGTYNSLNGSIQVEGIDVVNASDLTVEYVKAFSTDSSDPEAEPTSVTAADAKMLGSLVNIIAGSMNALFDDSSLTSSSIAKTEGIRNSIRSAISESFDSEGPQYDTDFGIHLDFEKTEKGVFNFSEADQLRFETALTNPEGEAAVRDALFGTESNGLFNRLHSALTAATPDSGSNVWAAGLFLDIVV